MEWEGRVEKKRGRKLQNPNVKSMFRCTFDRRSVRTKKLVDGK